MFDPLELTAWGVSLWRCTWQTVVVAMVVWFIDATCRNWIAPRWRVALWLLPVARMILIVLPASSLSLFNLLDDRHLTEIPSAVAEVRQPTQAVRNQFRADQGGVELAVAGTELDDLHASQRRSDKLAAVNETQLAQVTVGNPQIGARRVGTWPVILCWTWLAGCVVSCSYLVSLRWFVARVLAGATTADDAVTNYLAVRCCELGIRRRVRCLVAPQNLGPATIGVFRPAILLPRSLLSELPAASITTIIEHELQHVRRWDALILGVSLGARSLHWFNPIAYRIDRRLRQAVEIAADCSTLLTLGESAKRSYGELLIQLSQRHSQLPGLSQAFASASALKSRIKELSMPTRSTTLRSTTAVGLILGLTVALLSDAAPPLQSQPAEPSGRYFLAGLITDADTRKPVADTEIQFAVIAAPETSTRVLSGRSDDQGRYRIAVPPGDIHLGLLPLKDGYWFADPGHKAIALTTSMVKPVAEHDITVRRAPQWRVSYVGRTLDESVRSISVTEMPDDKSRQRMLAREPMRWKAALNQWEGKLNPDGTGAFTQIGDCGKLIVTVLGSMAELIIEKGFDNNHVVAMEVQPGSERIHMVDADGRSAFVGGADVTLSNARPTVVFKGPGRGSVTDLLFVGEVVDADGQPVAGAVVYPVEITENSRLSSLQSLGNSDSEGRFSVEFAAQASLVQLLSKRVRLGVEVRAKGFATGASPAIKLTADRSTVDVGRIALQPGYDLPIRVVDIHGKPVSGAQVSIRPPQHVYSPMLETDDHGLALAKDLPAGMVGVYVRYDRGSASTHVIVEPKPANEVATVHFIPFSRPGGRPERLAVGSSAPEWELGAWTDGQEHSLAEYRGKVLVIDFWSMRFGSSSRSMPAMQRLVEAYENKGVAFIGIHTPEGDLEQIRKLNHRKGWTAPTAIDQADSSGNGRTGLAYGAFGQPALLIVDARGTIAYRSDSDSSLRQALSEDQRMHADTTGGLLGSSAEAADDKSLETTNRILIEHLSRELDRALGAN